jgi:hypothetical protein
MKINVHIDATPEEMRTFFGLPDVGPLQRQWLAQLEAGMKTGMVALDPATTKLVSSAFAEQIKMFDAMQKGFWQAFASPATKPEEELQPSEVNSTPASSGTEDSEQQTPISRDA